VIMASQSFLAIGKVVKAFGIRGEIVVRSFADSPGRFGHLKSVFVGPDEGTAREIQVEGVRVEVRGVRLKLVDVDDRTAAEKFVGALVFVDGKNRVKPPRGRFFVHEVVGLRVLDETGRVLGTVREILKLPAQDVYVIERHGRDILVPAVKEFVQEIDPVAGVIRVRLIEGMVEE
jgi:16S rRNA processing protein RimM